MKVKEFFSDLLRDIVWWWAKIFIGPPLRLFFRVRSENKKKFPPRRKPAFVIANHTNLLDPFIVADFFNRPIRYVVSDEYFRYRPLRFLLNLVKGIPKTKYIPDSVTMRNLLRALKKGELIGIFPEGARNWDGETMFFDDTIPKLVHRFKVPVICIQMQGAHISFPRWSNWPRRVMIVLKFHYLFEKPEEVPEDVNQIKKMIAEKFYYNEFDSERFKELKLKFEGIKPAEHLELRLWLCPVCKSFFSLQSKGRHISCTKCKAKWEFRKEGHFRLIEKGVKFNKNSLIFSNYIDWVRWNDRETIKIVKAIKKDKPAKAFEMSAKMWRAISETTRDRNFKFIGRGLFFLKDAKNIVFIRDIDKKIILDVSLKDIKGAAVTWNHKFEFFVGKEAYRLTFYGQSAYFWHFLSKIFRNNFSLFNFNYEVL